MTMHKQKNEDAGKKKEMKNKSCQESKFTELINDSFFQSIALSIVGLLTATSLLLCVVLSELPHPKSCEDFEDGASYDGRNARGHYAKVEGGNLKK